jgi:pimeloyl-ACP methyl ester carboxylesterase
MPSSAACFAYDRDLATYALIHGAGDVGWYWHLVVPELRRRGHDVVAPDLPCDDDSAGWSEYADTVVEAIGDRIDVVVVAQSLGGFTAPLVCDRLPVDLMVLVAAMVPAPGETGNEWWANTGYEQAVGEPGDGEDSPASEEDELIATFYQDVPRELAAEAVKRGRDQAETPMLQPWPLEGWPQVPTRFLLCRDDRCFPAEFLRRVVRERLGITPDEIDCGHTPALSRPKELAERFDVYLTGR